MALATSPCEGLYTVTVEASIRFGLSATFELSGLELATLRSPGVAPSFTGINEGLVLVVGFDGATCEPGRGSKTDRQF
jgi:hypothetical protein